MYELLENDGDGFRLIRLHPGEPDDPIVLTLVPTRLSEKPHYIALSYVWGPPGNEKAVSVDGAPMLVRPSLFDFLTVLRKRDHAQLFFADAICINQDDWEERSWQVPMMKDIYKGASEVVASMGQGNKDIDVLFALAKCIDAAEDYHEDKEGHGIWTSPSKYTQTPHRDLVDALWQVLERPYWKRAWIVQECLLARHITLYAGAAQVSWEQFTNVHMLLLDKPPKARKYVWGFVGDSTISRFDHVAGEKTDMSAYPVSFAYIINKFNAAESTNPHDMVYAFSALTQELQQGHPRQIPVDYKIPLTSLYFCVGYACLGDPKTAGRPHRILPILRTMLGVTTRALLDRVLALMDPDDLLSPVDWIVGDWQSLGGYEGRTFREERKSPDLHYMDCHASDFCTLVRLDTERRQAGSGKV